MSSPTAELITEECNALRELLLQKNAAYGDAAINPVRIFSKASPEEQIRVRLDDKISRLARGHNAGEDVELDLMGYLVLLRVSRRVQALGSVLQGIKEAEEGKTHDLGDFSEYAEPAPTPAIDPGAGYRLLEPGEILQEGDEVGYAPGTSGFLRKGYDWEPTIRYRDGDDRVGGFGIVYRRKLPAAPAAPKEPDPGPGYRLLGDDEVLREGDEFWEFSEWNETICSGMAVSKARHPNQTPGTRPYRRKLEAPGRSEHLESPVE